VIGRSDEECQAGIDRLIASGEARPTHRFMCRLIGMKQAAGSPGPNGAESDALEAAIIGLRF
jgi:hypothetical protein